MFAAFSVWVFALSLVMAACCWRVAAQRGRARRCAVAVRAVCVGAQGRTWLHGDAGDETPVWRPVYAYEFGGVRYETAAGAATTLFDRSPAAMGRGEAVELRVNPENPAEAYDPAYESWFAKYRFAWGLLACVAAFALVKLLDAIS